MKRILSARYLSHRLGVPLPQLRKLAKEITKHYRQRDYIDEEKGKTRKLKVPDHKLKLVQRRVLRRILDPYPLPDVAHGGVKGKSPRTNAAQHCGKTLVVSMDIRNFFPSVSHHQVAKMFQREFGCGREARWLLTRLTTIDGCLPQGTPTSTAIANIVLATTVDKKMENLAQESQVALTRFVDDFGISGARATLLINGTAQAASRVGLSVWRKRKKLKIMPASRRQEITGLNVNSPDGPSVSQEKRDRIRAAIHQLRNLPASEVSKAIQSIRGRLNHLNQYNPGAASRLHKQFDRVLRERK
ncbi:MAG: reverse transcriptase family protein [Gammaproteobacteria bacterium]|nr:reverse transcriptase family protein [Gammaproteobacteria bacterium]